LLRGEAERLLEATPHDCRDLLAWSAEGYAVGLIASVLAEAAGRELQVHRASLVAPLATSPRTSAWAWLCAEELLGIGGARAWATSWATTRGGRPYRQSDVRLAIAS
jgi:hypothetical protein